MPIFPISYLMLVRWYILFGTPGLEVVPLVLSCYGEVIDEKVTEQFTGSSRVAEQLYCVPRQHLGHKIEVVI